MTQPLVVLGGLGDVYLVAALYESFCRRYGRIDAELVIKSGHVDVVNLFDTIQYRVDDALTFGVEANRAFQQEHPNDLWTGQPFFVHPCMVRTKLSIDALPARPFVCQADLFRMVLGLPLTESPLARARVPTMYGPVVRDSVMIVEANTWPDTQPGFYPKLVERLRAAGRDVWINDKTTPLRELFARAAATEWVIGPQCGLMSIFVAGRFPCRKTLATPSIDGARTQYWAPATFPYAYVTRFAGEDFDVEEIKVEDDHAAALDAVMTGPNFRRSRPHDPNPVVSIQMPLAPGDFLDRLAVLTVKRHRFSPERRAAIEREYQRHAEAARLLLGIPGARGTFDALVKHHGEAFDVLERAVPGAFNGGMHPKDHVDAIRLNKVRVGLKQKLDALLGAAYTEVKSYYG